MFDPEYRASQEQKRNYLSESHKIKARLLQVEFWNRVFFFVFPAAAVFIILTWLNSLTMKPQDRQAIEKIEAYRKQVDSAFINKQVTPEYHAKYVEYLDRQRKKIEEKYPPPYILFNLLRTEGNRFMFILVYLLPLLSTIGFYVYLRKRFAKDAKEFFYQTAGQEDPLGLPAEIKVRFFVKRYPGELINKTFKDVDTLMRILQFASSGIKEEKAVKVIDDVMKDVKDYLSKYYPTLNTPETHLKIEFILWHYAVSLYGNAPTGLIGKYINSPDLRKAITLYTRRHLPVLYDTTTGKPLKQNYPVYVLLTCLYSADRDRQIFGRINQELNPLPF